MGLNRIVVSDYSPINGDWQNYNPVRRTLAGYVPYVDFSPYLGLGIIAMTAPFVIVSNTFTTSLFATNFISIVCFILSALTIFYITTKRLKVSMFGSLVIFVALTAWRSKPIAMSFYNELMLIGNSFRMGRSFLPIFLTLLMIFTLKIKKIDIFTLLFDKKSVCVIGFICGFFALWSNDYGFCSVAAGGTTLFTALIYKKIKCQNLFSRCALFSLSAIIGLLVSAAAVTLGHPLKFIQTSIGIGEYQYWYYGSRHITDLINLVKVQFPLTFPVPLCYAVLAVKALKKRINCYDVLVFFLITTSLFASVLYTFGSGGVMNTFLLYVSLTTLLGLVIDLIMWLISRYVNIHSIIVLILRIAFTIMLSITLSINCFSLAQAAKAVKEPKNIPYISELGGYSHLGNSLKIAKEHIGDNKLFSTYAGALESMTGQFQPTGTDYIIHVLGDEQRKAYIEVFTDGGFRFVQTIRPDFNSWEKWVASANWFFYRELIKNYSPIILTDCSVIWEKQSIDLRINSANATVKINKDNAYTSRINVTVDQKIDCIADVVLEYDTELITDGLIYKMYLLAKDTNAKQTTPIGVSSPIDDNWGLPTGKTISYSVPVIICDGMGEITLTAFPNNSTKLFVANAQTVNLLPIPDIYSSLPNTTANLTDNNWTNGVATFGNILLFPNNGKYKELLLQSIPQTITANSYTAEITEITERDAWIWVKIADSADKDKFQFPVELIFN